LSDFIIVQNSNALINVFYFLVAGRYHIAINQLKEAGASAMIDEENVVGHKMAQDVLDFLFTAIPYSMACGLAGKQSDIPADGTE
jgi:hypothetical protein